MMHTVWNQDPFPYRIRGLEHNADSELYEAVLMSTVHNDSMSIHTNPCIRILTLI